MPVERAAKIKAPTLIMDGGESAMPFMRHTADRLGKAIQNSQRRTVGGQGHDVSAKAVTPLWVEFFKG